MIDMRWISMRYNTRRVVCRRIAVEGSVAAKVEGVFVEPRPGAKG